MEILTMALVKGGNGSYSMKGKFEGEGRSKMEQRIDFLERLETDMTLNILMRLDDPADIVSASAVSRSWHHLVMANGLLKQLSLMMFPQLSNNICIIVPNSWRMNNVKIEQSSAIEMEGLEREHHVYASLLQALYRSEVSPRDCMANAISASSTDHDPNESIVNTLSPWSRSQWGIASYWSSKGHSDPDVPETLTYRLKAGISIVTEIDIQPFEVYWEPDRPICSAKSVRFRMGYGRSQCLPLCKPDDNFVWTYTSPTFPMKQENQLQQFKLPKPVLCISMEALINRKNQLQQFQASKPATLHWWISAVELFGRVQRQKLMDYSTYG
ncbi:F-box protein [Sesamum angolense]|uniref:F-box protein n=1 Tax=Sesamum angolense TaxID=2727404 RepID=A0AAE1WQB1_9LAMI|nr:F-box protein [Sesamum angolense]